MKRHILRLVSQEDHSFLLMLWQYVTVSQLAGSYWQCVCVVSCYLVVSEKRQDNNWEKTKNLYLTAINQWLLVVTATFTDCHPQAGSMRGVFSRYIGPGPGETRRGPSISEEPHVLSYKSFFFFFFVGIFNYF